MPASLTLLCTLCDRLQVVGRDAIDQHVTWHKLVGDDVQVWWAAPNGLVLKLRERA